MCTTDTQDETPIQEKADKLTLRRWAHFSTPHHFRKCVPPISDKWFCRNIELTAKQYGRYMEFTDKVNFAVVDPVVAHYTRQYAIVAIETFDMLARETSSGNSTEAVRKGSKGLRGTSTVASIPNLTDLRMIVFPRRRRHL